MSLVGLIIVLVLVGLIIVLVIAGIALWAVNAYIPMEPRIKGLLNILVVVVMAVIVIVFLLNLAGVSTGPVRLH